MRGGGVVRLGWTEDGVGGYNGYSDNARCGIFAINCLIWASGVISCI